MNNKIRLTQKLHYLIPNLIPKLYGGSQIDNYGGLSKEYLCS